MSKYIEDMIVDLTSQKNVKRVRTGTSKKFDVVATTKKDIVITHRDLCVCGIVYSSYLLFVDKKQVLETKDLKDALEAFRVEYMKRYPENTL